MKKKLLEYESKQAEQESVCDEEFINVFFSSFYHHSVSRQFH